MISIHDPAAIDTFCRERRIDVADLRRFRNAFYKRRATREAALEELPSTHRAEVASSVAFESLVLHRRLDSTCDGATKLIFETARGFLIETVILRIATGRVALCVSSQVGCAVNCRFCATGKMGVAQSLTSDEILDQVLLAGRLLKEERLSIRNVVFMGMGEPLQNEVHLNRALDVLGSPRCFNLAPGRILVSTVGVPDAMLRFARRHPEVRLAVSLHSADQQVRERIIPLARHCRLEELRDALSACTAIQQQPVMIEYLLLKDVNDSPHDAAALIDYLHGIPVHVNLIPFNPIDGAPELQTTDTPQRTAFANLLKAAGLRVTLRYSLGADIAAACGQLIQSENRRIAAARRS